MIRSIAPTMTNHTAVHSTALLRLALHCRFRIQYVPPTTSAIETKIEYPFTP